MKPVNDIARAFFFYIILDELSSFLNPDINFNVQDRD